MKCEFCGKEFTQTRRNHRFCSNLCCTRYHDSQSRSFKKYVPPPKTGKSLAEWQREAAECNLDYGSYRAFIAAGKTFDELKSTAHLRSTPIHARKTYHGSFTGCEKL